jgi:hypothetical protein
MSEDQLTWIEVTLWSLGKKLDDLRGALAQAIKRLLRLASGRGATLYCSFCGKSQHEVKKLVAGPRVFICDECTDLCHGVVHKDEPP